MSSIFNKTKLAAKQFIRKPKALRANTEPRKGRFGRRFARTIIITLGILFILNFTLPYIILWQVNKKMANMPDYTGHIDDMRMNLFIGSVTVFDFDFKKKTGNIPVPFMFSNNIKVGVEWKSLLKGRLVAKIAVDSFAVNFVKGPTKAQSQTSVDSSWIDLADKLMPISINRVEVRRGEVHYRDYFSSPKIDILANRIYVLAENLSNVKDSVDLLPSKVMLKANIYGGSVNVKGRLDALSKVPMFDISAEVKKMPLPKLNDFTKAYGKFDVQKGYFSVYAEAASKNNKIKGYVKPFVEDLDVLNLRDEKTDPVGTKLYEGLIELGSWFVENHKKDDIATRIEIEGDLKQPKISVWQVITDLLRNAFVKALFQSVDNTVSIHTVGKERDKTFLEKVFGSGNKEVRKKDRAERKKDRQDKKKASKDK